MSVKLFVKIHYEVVNQWRRNLFQFAVKSAKVLLIVLELRGRKRGGTAKIPNKLLAKDEDLNSWGPKLAKLASEALASFTWSSIAGF